MKLTALSTTNETPQHVSRVGQQLIEEPCEDVGSDAVRHVRETNAATWPVRDTYVGW